MRAPYLSENAVAFAQGRGIGRVTLERLGVGSGMAFFPDLKRQAEALIFRFGEHWKARALAHKSFVAEKGMRLEFWNIANVLQSDMQCVFIVEGELDACSLVEAGVEVGRVLSVPNGAAERKREDGSELRGYGFVQDALAAGLAKAKRIVWCGDKDVAGEALRADMVALFGAARFHYVTWPEGCKDANDYLRSDGRTALLDLVTNGALPWPAEGVFRMDELPSPTALQVWHPGFAEWESKVFLAPRTLAVVTGHPGHGKTALMAQIICNIVREYDVPACIASFETRAKPHYRRILRQLLCGARERDLIPDELDATDDWINERYVWLVHPEQRPTLQWFLDQAEIAVVRYGARIVQLDPWNRLEASRHPRESETDYVARCLRALYVFANDMNVHVQIVAHPAKMEGSRRGTAPALEDIAGSKHWDNMCDQGFVVHRKQMFDGARRCTEATLFHVKARFDELGHPCKLALDYDIARGRYVSTDYVVGGYQSAAE